jgi:hypothetical protein
MSADIHPLAPVASSTASAILPVLFSGKDSALIISASVMAAKAGVKVSSTHRLHHLKKRFMAIHSKVTQRNGTLNEFQSTHNVIEAKNFEAKFWDSN